MGVVSTAIAQAKQLVMMGRIENCRHATLEFETARLKVNVDYSVEIVTTIKNERIAEVVENYDACIAVCGKDLPEDDCLITQENARWERKRNFTLTD